MSDDKYTDIVSDGGMDPRNENQQEKDANIEAALQEITDIGQEIENARKIYEHDNDTWWDSLSEEEREDAFYAVIKRMYKAELVKHGTYRYALYDVFGFDPGMYGRGMDCGYMALHNAIFDGEELQAMKRVNRLEVIDETGRAYTKYLDEDQRVRYNLQDDNNTLKVSIDNVKLIDPEDL